MQLTDMYRPITAAPFRKNSAHCEIEPCAALKPYIRCFWGTPEPIDGIPSDDERCGLIIPDTCMDIVFRVNYTANCVHSIFCALDERSVILPADEVSSSKSAVFGIRFYAWTAAPFSEDTLSGSKNGRYPADAFFSRLKREIEPILFETETLSEKVCAAEKILLKNLHTERVNPDFMNAVHRIISTGGSAKIGDLTGCTASSEKRLERLFAANAGISPKTLCALIRYQMLWQEIVSGNGFNAADAVEKYGYFDQAHMLNDFRRRHLMNPTEAVRFAKKYAN